MQRLVDARKDTCPVPLIKAKRGLRELKTGDSLLVKTDNAIAMENLLKMAGQLKLRAEGRETAGGFEVEFYYEGQKLDARRMETPQDCGGPEGAARPAGNGKVVVIGSETMGTGDDALGRLLMKGFLYALAGLEEPPEAVLFYNGGVRLACEGSEALEDLRLLAGEGVTILSCGTCLDYYQLKDRLLVGGVTNMYDIVEKQNGASVIIRP